MDGLKDRKQRDGNHFLLKKMWEIQAITLTLKRKSAIVYLCVKREDEGLKRA
jgi:hypothetical protein